MKLGAIMVLLVSAGCATGSGGDGEGEYQRVDAQLRAADEFELRKEACVRAGGMMRVTTTSGARQPPRARDLKRATCERRDDLAGW